MREELSEREKQVAAHLAAGLRVAGVASELCIAEVTVRNHLRNIFGKLDVHSQTDLIGLLRGEPALLGSYRLLSGSTGLEDRPLKTELEAADQRAASRLDEAFDTGTGRDAMKAALRAVLPLDEERRREWRTRLAVQALADDQRDLRTTFGEQRQQWMARQARRIGSLQDLGWVRGDLDVDDVRRRLFAAVYAASMALLADTSAEEQARQLETLDALIDSIADE